MTTENIDIRIREDGSTVVRRNIESIAPAARSSASAVDFLKTTLASLGGALAVRELLRLVDTFSNLQNRLRATGLEGESLTAVYQNLLKVSNDTRSSVEGSVELYSRLAISSKELGVSQKQLIDFTKTLNQTILLSGASAAEAQGGLIQLAQGLASGKLQGDELRSILENLPVVADVIAKSLKVTRGELRQLGTDGKITAQVVLKAFQEARGEIEGKFAKTVPTLSQSFQVLKNNVVDFIGRIDQMTGFSTALSKAIMLIATNIDTIAEAVVRLTKVLLTAATAYGVFFAAGRISDLAQAATAFAAYRSAIAAGTVVVLGSAEAERQKAAAVLAGAVASQTAAAAQNAAAIASARAAAVTTAAQLEQAVATQAGLALTREELVAKLAKANADIASARATQVAAQAAGAQSFALASLRAATIAQTQAEAARGAVLTELATLGATQTRVTAANTAAVQANAAAQLRLAEAQAAAAASGAANATAVAAASTRATTAAAAAAGTTSLFGQAMGALGRAATAAGNAVKALFALINTNPFTAIAVALTVAIGLLITFGDQFNAGIDQATTMKDVLQALGEVGMDALRGLYDAVTEVFGGLADVVVSAVKTVSDYLPSGVSEWLTSFTTFYDDVGTGFAGVVRGIAKTFDAIGGLVTGMLIFIARGLAGLPTIFETVFKQAYNLVTGVIEDMVNEVIGGVNKLRSLVSKEPLELVKFAKLEVDENAYRQFGADLATSIGDGFEQQGGFLLKKVDDVFARAQQIQQDRSRKLALDKPNLGVSDVASKPIPPPVDKKELEKATNALRALLNTIKPSEGAVLELAKAQETLNNALRLGLFGKGAEALKKYNEYLQLAKDYYADIINPLGKINRELDAESNLLKVNNHEREVERQLYSITSDLKRQGIKMTEDETAALRAKLQALRDQNAMTQAQDSLLQNSVGQRRDFSTQAQAIQNLSNDTKSGFTAGDKATAVNGIAPDLFQGTQTQLDAQKAAFEAMYAQIQVLRDKDLINEQTASTARQRINIMEKEARLKSTSEFFGNLASLSSSGNKKIAAIGRAAAMTQATIDGVLAVQKALAAPPGWPYNAANVIAVGVSAAANVAKIAGFESGGYTGDMGTGKIAGVVHGQEYVVNADATKRNRATLEAMNAGQTIGGVREVNVSIVVNTPPGMEVTEKRERNTPDGKEIELTIAKVVMNDVRKGGPISQTFEGQYPNLNRAQSAPR